MLKFLSALLSPDINHPGGRNNTYFLSESSLADSSSFLAVKLAQHEGAFILTVKDDGPGINQSQDEEKSASFGQLLMQTLAEQLEGTLEVTDAGNGTQVTLRFPSKA